MSRPPPQSTSGVPGFGGRGGEKPPLGGLGNMRARLGRTGVKTVKVSRAPVPIAPAWQILRPGTILRLPVARPPHLDRECYP